MKSKDVLRLLQITRPTLTKYVKEGIIRVNTLPNGQYDYFQEDVYTFLNKGVTRATYVYASIWKNELKQDISNQIDSIKQYCLSKGYTISGVYTDTNCTYQLESRPQLTKVIDDIIVGKVERVIISDQFRLSQYEYELLQYIIERCCCKLEILVQV